MKRISALFSFLLMISCASLSAQEIYQKPKDFIKMAFSNEVPASKTLWLNKEHRKVAETILGERPKRLRVRFWQQHERTAWILEAIGKDRPITAGIVINQGKIEQIKILIFRESRGWEVRHDFFTHQFNNVQLTQDHRLTQSIDSISGATLSVRAVKAMARLALYYHAEVQKTP